MAAVQHIDPTRQRVAECAARPKTGDYNRLGSQGGLSASDLVGSADRVEAKVGHPARLRVRLVYAPILADLSTPP